MCARSSTAAQCCSSSGPHGSVPVIFFCRNKKHGVIPVQHKGQPWQQRCEISLTQEELLTVVTQHTFKAHLLVLLCPLTPKTLFEWTLQAQTSEVFSLWLRCITEKTAWPAASEWTMVDQLLRRAAVGRRSPLGSARGRWGEAERVSGGQLPPWEAGRRGSSFSPGSAARKFQPRLAEPRVAVELPSHKGNMSGLYQILLPFHSSLPSAPSHSLFPRIEFAAAHIIFSREIVLIRTNKYLICHC